MFAAGGRQPTAPEVPTHTTHKQGLGAHSAHGKHHSRRRRVAGDNSSSVWTQWTRPRGPFNPEMLAGHIKNYPSAAIPAALAQGTGHEGKGAGPDGRCNRGDGLRGEHRFSSPVREPRHTGCHAKRRRLGLRHEAHQAVRKPLKVIRSSRLGALR